MTTSSQTTTYNLQEPKKKKTLQVPKLKMGMIKTHLQVATFKKYEFELKIVDEKMQPLVGLTWLIFVFKCLSIIGY